MGVGRTGSFCSLPLFHVIVRWYAIRIGASLFVFLLNPLRPCLEEDDAEQLAMRLAQIRRLQGGGTEVMAAMALETKSQFAPSSMASPVLPRHVANMVQTRGKQQEDVLQAPDWRRYTITPESIGTERLAAQMAMQGAGLYSVWDLQHPSFGIYQRQTNRLNHFAFIDLFVTAAPAMVHSETQESLQESPRRYVQEMGPSLPPPRSPRGESGRSRSIVSARSPRGEKHSNSIASPRSDRSGSVFEAAVQAEKVPLVLCAVTPKQIQLLMDSKPPVCSHMCLQTTEIQLSLLAREGKCFHILLLIEDTKSLETNFATSQDQWNHTTRGTSKVWVAQPSGGLQRICMGSKHETAGGLRLWRTAWRRRPNPACVVFEYLVAVDPDIRRHAFKGVLSSVKTDESIPSVRESDIFIRRPEAILSCMGANIDGQCFIVTHEQSCVRISSVATRMTLREIPIEARKSKLSGYLLALIMTDEPIVKVYDVINSNRPCVNLVCPQVAPSDIIIRLIGPLKQKVVLVSWALRM